MGGLQRFLRYNSRHHFYWRLGGKPRYEGDEATPMGWPKINPIDGMIYGGGIKNISWHEPLWLFRWRQRVFADAGVTTCQGNAAMWNWGPDGARTCSYCGSLHPADWTDIMWRFSQGEEGYTFDRSDKGYKDYGSRPNVVNASQGGIKFYGWHVPEPSDPLHDELYAARQLATTKWTADMRARWGPTAV